MTPATSTRPSSCRKIGESPLFESNLKVSRLRGFTDLCYIPTGSMDVTCRVVKSFAIKVSSSLCPSYHWIFAKNQPNKIGGERFRHICFSFYLVIYFPLSAWLLCFSWPHHHILYQVKSSEGQRQFGYRADCDLAVKYTWYMSTLFKLTQTLIIPPDMSFAIGFLFLLRPQMWGQFSVKPRKLRTRKCRATIISVTRKLISQMKPVGQGGSIFMQENYHNPIGL